MRYEYIKSLSSSCSYLTPHLAQVRVSPVLSGGSLPTPYRTVCDETVLDWAERSKAFEKDVQIIIASFLSKCSALECWVLSRHPFYYPLLSAIVERVRVSKMARL
eukprot:scaffold580011_cov18-Prasinocladus_malaysianus.AAC.1